MDAKEDLHLGFPSPPFILLILFSGLCASFSPPLSLFRFLLNIWKDSRQVRGNGLPSPISPQSLLCISKTSWSGPDESSRPRQIAIIRWPGLPRYAHVHVECIKCLCVNGSVCVCVHVFLLSYNLVYSVHVYMCVCVCACCGFIICEG